MLWLPEGRNFPEVVRKEFTPNLDYGVFLPAWKSMQLRPKRYGIPRSTPRESLTRP